MTHAYLTITVIIMTCCTLAYVEAASKTGNGGWSRWGRWGRCSKTCDGGIQIRKRTCTNPRPSGGGRQCPGAGLARRRCPCRRVNGRWSGYGQWSSCSKLLCGSGTRTRTRSCTKPRPSCCGASCKGSSRQTGRCNTRSCRPIEIMAKKFAQAVMFKSTLSNTKSCSRRSLTRRIVCKKVCRYRMRDFLIIMDSSGSITQTKYDAAKIDMALLASSLCGNLGTDLQVAVMQFANNPQKEFAFDEYDDVMDLFDGVMAMSWLKGGTRTWLAFKFARDTMFKAANGHRSGAKKQALIVTDGKSNGATNAGTKSIAAALALKNSDVEVFALWIGSPTSSSLKEIRKYASDPKDDHVFSVDSVASLHYLVVNIWLIHGKICCP